MTYLRAVRKHCKGCRLAASTGAAMAIIGLIIGGFNSDDLILIGLTITIIAVIRMIIWPALRPQVDLYSDAWESGHDQGVMEERRRSAVVPLFQVPNDARQLTDKG